MEVQNKVPARRRGSSVRKGDQLSQEEALKQLLESHKKSIGEVVWVKIDDRTHIELPANMSEKEREKRIKNYLMNVNYKLK